jgi:hypothetical protein
MDRRTRLTRVQMIIRAGEEVDDALDHLSRLSADDCRFAGSLLAYEHALEARTKAEAAQR